MLKVHEEIAILLIYKRKVGHLFGLWSFPTDLLQLLFKLTVKAGRNFNKLKAMNINRKIKEQVTVFFFWLIKDGIY